jgi:hypothetical protein
MASAFVSSRPRTRRCVRTLTNSCNVCTTCLRLNRRRTLFLPRCCPQLRPRAIFTPCNRASLASKINWVRLSSADSFNCGVFTLSILSCKRTSPFATQERSHCARRDQCRSHVRSLGCFLTRCISNPIQSSRIAQLELEVRELAAARNLAEDALVRERASIAAIQTAAEQRVQVSVGRQKKKKKQTTTWLTRYSPADRQCCCGASARRCAKRQRARAARLGRIDAPSHRSDSDAERGALARGRGRV